MDERGIFHANVVVLSLTALWWGGLRPTAMLQQENDDDEKEKSQDFTTEVIIIAVNQKSKIWQRSSNEMSNRVCHETTFFRNLNLDSDIPWHQTILIPKIRKKMRHLRVQFKNFENAWEVKKSKCENHINW